MVSEALLYGECKNEGMILKSKIVMQTVYNALTSLIGAKVKYYLK